MTFYESSQVTNETLSLMKLKGEISSDLLVRTRDILVIQVSIDVRIDR